MIATDIDHEALTAARVNIETNSAHPREDLAPRIMLRSVADVEERPSPPDIVVANVTLDVHRAIVDDLRDAGTVICSGVLDHQVRALEDLYLHSSASTILVSGEWVAIEFSSSTSLGRKT